MLQGCTYNPKRKRYSFYIKGPSGAVDVWYIYCKRSAICPTGVYGGIELHSKAPLYDEQKPLENCNLTDGDCYTSGSTLQFDERLLPMLELAPDNPEANLDNWAVCISTALDYYRHHFPQDAPQPEPEGIK